MIIVALHATRLSKMTEGMSERVDALLLLGFCPRQMPLPYRWAS